MTTTCTNCGGPGPCQTPYVSLGAGQLVCSHCGYPPNGEPPDPFEAEASAFTPDGRLRCSPYLARPKRPLAALAPHMVKRPKLALWVPVGYYALAILAILALFLGSCERSPNAWDRAPWHHGYTPALDLPAYDPRGEDLSGPPYGPHHNPNDGRVGDYERPSPYRDPLAMVPVMPMDGAQYIRDTRPDPAPYSSYDPLHLKGHSGPPSVVQACQFTVVPAPGWMCRVIGLEQGT